MRLVNIRHTMLVGSGWLRPLVIVVRIRCQPQLRAGVGLLPLLLARCRRPEARPSSRLSLRGSGCRRLSCCRGRSSAATREPGPRRRHW
jgi:hypothetical protein